jgi:hypothetical protein
MVVSGFNSGAPGGAEDFATTHWSVALLAGQSNPAKATEALEKLCRAYWYPLYAFVRRQGHDAHAAQDLTQEFFSRRWAETLIDTVTRRLQEEFAEAGQAERFEELKVFLLADED